MPHAVDQPPYITINHHHHHHRITIHHRWSSSGPRAAERARKRLGSPLPTRDHLEISIRFCWHLGGWVCGQSDKSSRGEDGEGGYCRGRNGQEILHYTTVQARWRTAGGGGWRAGLLVRPCGKIVCSGLFEDVSVLRPRCTVEPTGACGLPPLSPDCSSFPFSTYLVTSNMGCFSW